MNEMTISDKVECTATFKKFNNKFLKINGKPYQIHINTMGEFPLIYITSLYDEKVYGCNTNDFSNVMNIQDSFGNCTETFRQHLDDYCIQLYQQMVSEIGKIDFVEELSVPI